MHLFLIIFCFFGFFNSNVKSKTISGIEIKQLTENWLHAKGIEHNLKILPELKFSRCENLIIQNISTNYSLIKISCFNPNEWSFILRNKIYTKKTKVIKKVKKESQKKVEFIVLNKNLIKGNIVRDNDILLLKKKIKNDSNYIKNREDIVGKKLKRTINSNTLIKKNSLEKIWLVTKNDLITIENNIGPIIIKIDGIAMENGDYSEKIKVMNSSSGEIISGFVKNNKKVIINAKQF